MASSAWTCSIPRASATSRADYERRMAAEGLQTVAGVGQRVARSIADFFAEQRNRDVIDDLLAEGVRWPTVDVAATPQPLAGQTVVLTGTMTTLTREQASARLEALGARVTSSVSKKTDYVVAADKAGSKKDKAEKLGVALLDEQGLVDLLNRHEADAS